MDFGLFTIEDRTWKRVTRIAFVLAGGAIGDVVIQKSQLHHTVDASAEKWGA